MMMSGFLEIIRLSCNKKPEVPAFTLVEPSLTCGQPKAKACTVLPSIYLQKSKSTITSQNKNQLLQVNAFMFVVVYHVCQSLGVNVVFLDPGILVKCFQGFATDELKCCGMII